MPPAADILQGQDQQKSKKKEKKEKEDARQFRVWVLLPFFGMHLSLELR